MSQNITNNAKITFNEESLDVNSPLVVRVEPNLKVFKYATTDCGKFENEGIVGENRKITYQILLINYSSKDFTNIKVKEEIISENTDISEITYIKEESLYENNNSTDISHIEFIINNLPKQSQTFIHYTIELSDNVPLNTKITSKSSVNYDENTTKDEENNVIPIEASIDVILDFKTTKIEATKTAPEHVLCGEDFDFNLVFENVGFNVAKEVTISDYLPDNFIINNIKVVNGGIELEREVHFNYNENANPIVITDVNDFLDIQPKNILVVTIGGKIENLDD